MAPRAGCGDKEARVDGGVARGGGLRRLGGGVDRLRGVTTDARLVSGDRIAGVGTAAPAVSARSAGRGRGGGGSDPALGGGGLPTGGLRFFEPVALVARKREGWTAGR